MNGGRGAVKYVFKTFYRIYFLFDAPKERRPKSNCPVAFQIANAYQKGFNQV